MMPGGSITTLASLQCPHGGTVQIVSSDTTVAATSAPVATMADQFIVVGCPFQIPATPPIPSPCILVQWLAGNPRMVVGGVPSLDQSSQGICIAATGTPQGPVRVVSTQTEVQGQ